MTKTKQNDYLEGSEDHTLSPIIEPEERRIEDASLPTWRVTIILIWYSLHWTSSSLSKTAAALTILWISLFLSLFLCSVDDSIVATALVDVASSIGGYDQSIWAVNSYMLTYMGTPAILMLWPS